MENAIYVINNGGYGDGTDEESGRVAVIEAWGGHIGHLFADKKYGLNHGNTTSPNINIQERRSWKYWHLERFDPMLGVRVSPIPNFSDPAEALANLMETRWIPEGLFHDCMDNNFNNPSNVTDPIIDNVMGYTNANILSAIGTGPDNLNDLRDILKTSFLPVGQNSNEVDNLFTIYQQ